MSQSQQSPIDLTNPILTDFGQNRLEIKWKKSVQGTILQDAHGVQVVFGGDERQYIMLDRKKFHLVQFHFHHPSEHWINGQQQTLELHVVHQNTSDGSRAVLGIFIDATSSAATVPALVAHLKAQRRAPNQTPQVPIATDPREWLPENTAEYYRYEGSLTTPDYDENVSWVVLRHPRRLPQQELAELIKVVRHPARLPQGMNRRYLLANFKP